MENKDDLKQNKSNKKKYILFLLLVLAITVIVGVIFSNVSDLSETIKLIKTVNGKYMWYAVISLGLYFITYPLSLCIIARANKFETHFYEDYLIGQSEFFFSAVTPFSTGGQPIQIILYHQNKIDSGKSTGIIMANFISMLFASNIFAIISLFYYERFSVNFNSSTVWMIGLGFAMNLFTLIFMILMSTCKFIRDFFKKILVGLSKLKLLGKYIEKGIPAFEKYCYNAQAASKEIFSHIKTFILSIFIKMISLAFYYAIPYFILKALGVELALSDMPFIILASAFAITTMVWVPTPGGMGGIEFAFTTIFTTFIVGAQGALDSIGVTGMVLWRALTYYLLMFISLISYIVYEIIIKKRRKEEVK